MVMERIAEFLGQLLTRHDHIDERHTIMATGIQTIIVKLTDQGQKQDVQGAQIDKLIADRDAKEQADLDKINALIDANSSKADANATKVAAALAAGDAGSAQPPNTAVGADSTTATTADGSVTTVDHATGTASTVDPSGVAAPIDTDAAAAAVQAAAAAGVSVPQD